MSAARKLGTVREWLAVEARHRMRSVVATVAKTEELRGSERSSQNLRGDERQAGVRKDERYAVADMKPTTAAEPVTPVSPMITGFSSLRSAENGQTGNDGRNCGAAAKNACTSVLRMPALDSELLGNSHNYVGHSLAHALCCDCDECLNGDHHA